MSYLFTFVLVILSQLAFADGSFSPYLSEVRLAQVEQQLQALVSKVNAEALERSYRMLVRKQMLSDLRLFYVPENQAQIDVAYAAFTPNDSHRPGADLGYGLHVVKRLETLLPDGNIKTIFVNEHWGENTSDRGLFLPDEIRIQTQVKDGVRRAPGSEKLYLFDVFRVGWTDRGAASLAQRSAYSYDKEQSQNLRITMRVPVSAPLSCRGCHSSKQNGFFKTFLQPNEERNHEAIVQDGFFRLPISDMHGFKEYVAYLKSKKTDPSNIESASAALLNAKERMAVPAMVTAIDKALEEKSVPELGEDMDLGVHLPLAGMERRQGVYFHRFKKRWYQDAVETLIEGKYSWWEPKSVIP